MPTKNAAKLITIVNDAASTIAKLNPRLHCPNCQSSSEPTEDLIAHYLAHNWPECCSRQMTLTTSRPPAKKPTSAPSKPKRNTTGTTPTEKAT